MADDDGYEINATYDESDSDEGTGWQSGDEEEDMEMEDHQDISDSEVDFETEMQKELDASMRLQSLQNSQGSGEPTDMNECSNDCASKEEVYNEDYFSSGSEDGDLVGGVPSKSKQRRKVMTNDELFYDPNMDDKDEKWVTKQREMNNILEMSKKGKGQSSSKSKRDVNKAPGSDAILSCPACLTMLCIDCQRHDTYKSQYRAMFVMNCTVVKDEILRYKEQRHKHRGKLKGKLVHATTEDQKEQSTESEIYHPVKCSECSTEVAVFDCDEVYHFFDVLSSYA